jgi:drug/metabolite transporter (DMT)-like permease
LKERLTKESLFLVLIGLIAAIGLVPIHNGTVNLNLHNLMGLAAVTGAAIVWSVSGVLGRLLSKNGVQAFDMALTRAFIGIVSSLPLVLIFEVDHMNASDLSGSFLLAICGGILGGGIGYLSYYYGLKIVSAGVASMLELITPIVGIALGITFLHEEMTMIFPRKSGRVG